jgi:hypothetical protein
MRLNFPPKLRRVLTYSDAWNVAAPTTSATKLVFLANSCYDPDNSGTGHQPRSFDQYCSSTGPYQVFRVLGVKAKVTALAIGAGGATPPAQIGSIVVAGFSTSGTYPSAPGGSAAINIWGNTEIPGWSGMAVNPGSPARSLEFDRSMDSIFGIPRTHLLGEDNYQGTYGASPTDLAFFYVGYQCADFATAQALTLLVTFEYDVQFEDPIFNAAS